MRFLRQSLIGMVLAALSLGLLAWAAQIVGGAVQTRLGQERTSPPARERVFAVGVVRAVPGTETPVLETFGEVATRRSLELRAAASGRVIELADGFEDGGVVRAGQILVRVDPADAQAARDRARADLLDAMAELRDAERGLALARDEEDAAQDQLDLRTRAFARQKDLAARGVGTAAAVEDAELAVSSARQSLLSRRQALAQAEARIDQAQTRILRAEIAVDEAERTLADTTVAAPFDGTLSDATLVEGRLVAANEKLAELIDPNQLEVAFRVSTAQYARLLDDTGTLTKAPVRAVLDVSGVDLEATGRIARVSAGSGDMQVGRVVFARLDVAPGFRPGDFVTVRVEEPALDNVVRLPALALGADGAVLVLDADDRLEAMPVTLVRRQGDDVLVRAPNLAGRDVVEARSPLLGAGISVRPLRREAGRIEAQAPEFIELTEERRAQLIAFVEANQRMPAAAKARVLAQLNAARVPAGMIARLESRMGG